MTEYIDRKTLIKAVEDLPNCYNGFSDTYDKACIIGLIEELPSVDVVERKKGKWIDYKCSECGEPIPISKVIYQGKVIWERCQKPNYCPNCGADMREES